MFYLNSFRSLDSLDSFTFILNYETITGVIRNIIVFCDQQCVKCITTRKIFLSSRICVRTRTLKSAIYYTRVTRSPCACKCKLLAGISFFYFILHFTFNVSPWLRYDRAPCLQCSFVDAQRSNLKCTLDFISNRHTRVTIRPSVVEARHCCLGQLVSANLPRSWFSLV